jgi:hypothetical protein
MWGLSSVKKAAKRILPKRICQAISVLKNGVFSPPVSPPLPKTPPAPAAPSLPTMITEEESRFFQECTARYVGRPGAIVDLGCWFGSTSIALAQGLRSRDPDPGEGREKVLGFDLFTWEQWMPAGVQYGLYQPGETFLPEARRLVADQGGGFVELARADLSTSRWDGGPIKILLVDAMKSESLTRNIAVEYYPSLTAGGLLIHQDYKHFYTSWIHIVQSRLRDYFRFDGSVPRSGTVAFEVLTPVPKDVIERAVEIADTSDREIDESFRYSLGLVGEQEHANIAAAHVKHYGQLGRNKQARKWYEEYRRRGLSEQSEFPYLRWVEQLPCE